MNKLTNKIIFTFVIASFIGCAAKMSYSPTSSYSEGEYRNINDEEILKAFQAAPQLKLPSKVAWYNMSRDSLINLIKFENEKTISGNYDIPKTLIEGSEPLFDYPYNGYLNSAQPVNFKEVRLLAARAKCDIVILVTSRFEEKRNINAWATLNILLLPALFTPYWHIDYRYSSEVFAFDVRNGYMYKHLEYSDDKKETFVNIWTAERTAKEVNMNLIKSASIYFKEELKRLFDEKSKIAKEEDAGAEE